MDSWPVLSELLLKGITAVARSGGRSTPTQVRAEVPHAVAVAIEQWDERRSGAVHIGATVYVERDTQKAILIGHGGEMLKKIGAAARREIERLVESKVFLELWVKVRKDWRARDHDLRELGYIEQE